MEILKNISQQNNDISLSLLWATFLPYWPGYLILATLCIGGAWHYLQTKFPMYESTASILIKDEKRGTEDSNMMASINMLSSKKTIEN